MATTVVTPSRPFRGLRPLDPRHDLPQVADLIERAFAGELDPSGQAALRELRLIGRLGRNVREALCVSLAAWIACTPIVAAYFHRLHPFSELVSNSLDLVFHAFYSLLSLSDFLSLSAKEEKLIS